MDSIRPKSHPEAEEKELHNTKKILEEKPFKSKNKVTYLRNSYASCCSWGTNSLLTAFLRDNKSMKGEEDS